MKWRCCPLPLHLLLLLFTYTPISILILPSSSFLFVILSFWLFFILASKTKWTFFHLKWSFLSIVLDRQSVVTVIFNKRQKSKTNHNNNSLLNQNINILCRIFRVAIVIAYVTFWHVLSHYLMLVVDCSNH